MLIIYNCHHYTEREQKLQELKKARFISILIDGSTDKGTLENEVVFVRYLTHDDVDSQGPKNLFLGIQDVKHANAQGIIDAIDTGLCYN
jgi:hypothetical protein